MCKDRRVYRYVLARVFSALITLFITSMLVFLALQAVPGDPAQLLLGMHADPQALAALRQQLGLDIPLWQRFAHWLSQVVQGDLGQSIFLPSSVRALVRDRLAVSLSLASGGIVLACLLGFPLGIAAALSQRHTRGRLGLRGLWLQPWLDPLIVAISQLGAAIPTFWLGLLLMLWLTLHWQLLPATAFVPWHEGEPGRTLSSLLLPVLTLGFGQAAVISRMTRSALLEILSEDYIRTARAKGLRLARVIRKHALRNALVSLVTIIALSFSQLLMSTIIVEVVFSIPGMGALLLQAIGNRDFPLLQGQILIYASIIILLNILVDISYGWLDPRIRYS